MSCVLDFVGPSDEDQFVGQEWLLQSSPHWEPWGDGATCVCLDVHAWSKEKPVLQRGTSSAKAAPKEDSFCSILLIRVGLANKSRTVFLAAGWLI